MRCAIMQPTYLPWSGYFNLIASVDVFVFLDSVQFEKQSWQTRNRILLQSREHLIIVPVVHAPLSTPICDIITSDRRSNWRYDHLKVLQAAYGKAPHGPELIELLEPFYALPSPVRLAEFNIALIECLTGLLDLKTRFVRASNLDCYGERTQRLIAICEELSASTYVSPAGSADYLAEDDFARNTNIPLEFQSFVPAPYPQYRANVFTSHLSIIDVIANIGMADTRTYVSEFS
jgi:hypothetical protein